MLRKFELNENYKKLFMSDINLKCGEKTITIQMLKNELFLRGAYLAVIFEANYNVHFCYVFFYSKLYFQNILILH